MKQVVRQVSGTVVYLFGPLGEYLWQRFKALCRYVVRGVKSGVKKILTWVGMFALAVLGGTIFEHFVQPALIRIHPIFADPPAGSVDMGRRADSVAELTLYATIYLTFGFVFAAKCGIQKALGSGVRAGIREFVTMAVLFPLFPILPALLIGGEMISEFFPDERP